MSDTTTFDPAATSRYPLHVDGPYESQARVLRLVGRDQAVLELGCARGEMSAALSKAGCRVTAIEMDRSAAVYAAAHVEHIIVADLDSFDASDLGATRFDVIVAADVLEHLRDPARTLRCLRPHLAPDGRVVMSIPNVAHAAVRFALLQGRFPYGDIGLLDRTHLRFYTRETLEEMLSEAGLRVTRLDRVTIDIADALIPIDLRRLPAGVKDWVLQQPEALTYQFVLVAVPNEPSLDPPREREPPRDPEDNLLAYQATALAEAHRALVALSDRVQRLESEIAPFRMLRLDRVARVFLGPARRVRNLRRRRTRS